MCVLLDLVTGKYEAGGESLYLPVAVAQGGLSWWSVDSNTRRHVCRSPVRVNAIIASRSGSLKSSRHCHNFRDVGICTWRLM